MNAEGARATSLSAGTEKLAMKPLRQRPFRLLFLLLCLLFVGSMGGYVVNIQRRYKDRVMDYVGYHVMGTGILLRRAAAALGDPWQYPAHADRDAYHLASVAHMDNHPLVVPRSFPNHSRIASAAAYTCYRMHVQWQNNTDGSDLTADADASGPQDSHLFFFFVPGNTGTWRQGAYWASALRLQAAQLRWSSRLHLYNFHFLEQANVHRGRLLRQQAMYVKDGVVAALASHGFAAQRNGTERWAYRDAAGARAEVWLVGHSMGGITAELVAAEYLPPGSVAGLLTFNSPLRAPPLFLDRPMRDLYRSLYQQPARLRPRVFTITSSDLDLQIESRTTYYLADHLYLYNTNAASVCERNLGHDDILRDYCVMTFASEMALAAATGRWSAAAYPPALKGGALPPLRPPPWRFTQWGRWCWQSAAWPAGPAVYVAYLLAEGTVPLARFGGDLLLTRLSGSGLLPVGARPGGAARGGWGLWGLIALTTTPSLLCVVLFYAALLWQWRFPRAAPPPWGWGALAREVPLWRLAWLTAGPLASGILAGGVTVRLLFSVAHGVRWLRVRLWDAVWTPSKRSLLFTALVVLYWVAATLADIAFSIRVLIWFLLSFLGALSIAQVEHLVLTGEEVLRQQRGGSSEAAPRIIVEPNLVLLSFTFLMSLHAFFDFHNHIVDWHHIIDPMNYVVEVLLLLLFVLQSMLPVIPSGVWRQLLQSRGSPLLAALTAASYGVAVGGLAYMLASPVELCRMLPCVVCIVPAYVMVVLFSVASLQHAITPTGEWKLKEKKT
ncbi:hypothetical protein STCU_10699 [Strigomonas culicis]|uniref:GPI inositol-deacylase n=1 Tax=Strigomonas culicis TaxID=28005 RepID=S9V377_9TRYP|nr:hypothetical protein STCU_10699 [Strigomonas culicis]|eukprot:EPY17290.1 hypothetical protein STCU_10699 [Strigomonas culicis]